MGHKNYVLVVAPNDYPGTKYSDKYCHEHQLVFWKRTGLVAGDGQVIHHKNENTFDNRFDNLELVSNEKHSRDHTSSRSKKIVNLNCPHCRVPFIKPYARTHLLLSSNKKATFCSSACAGSFWANHKNSPDEAVDELLRDNAVSVEIVGGDNRRTNQMRVYREAMIRRRLRNMPRFMRTWANCATCGSLFRVRNLSRGASFCSTKCSAVRSRKGVQKGAGFTPEELRELIWTEPTRKLCKGFGISDTALSKWCKKWGIAKPPRGYWARKPEEREAIKREMISAERVQNIGVVV